MKRRLGTVVTFGAALLAMTAHGDTTADRRHETLPPVLDMAAIDPSVDPCVDFYEHACGAWLEANPVPPDQTIWWRFNALDEHTRTVLAAILEEAAADQGPSTDSRSKIGDYYASCLDEAGIEAKGLAPFAPELARIAALSEMSELPAAVARLHLLGAAPFFSFSSVPDYTDATTVIAEADQGGFALPDRDYYLTDAFEVERDAYRAHLARMFGLLGDDADKAEAQAEAVMRVETALAEAATALVERRDPQTVHHKMTLSDFAKLTPSFDWRAYLSALGAPDFTSLDVADPGFFAGLDNALRSIPLSDWKAYLRWTYLNGLVAAAPKALVEANFAFFGRTLAGQEEIQERWKRCVGAVDVQLGDALGEAYVERKFSPEAKARVLEMVSRIEAAMKDDIEALEWMSAETKARALEKLETVVSKIGYPDTWIDYAALDIVRGDALGNMQRAAAFELRRQLAKIGKPTDRGEWDMTPPTNDAYYDPQMNDMNFPAGILQLPNFDLNADDAVNYGNIGSTIGHELTHGFDDEGRHYDAQGNLTDWWTAADAMAFEARAAGFADQYGAFVAVKDPSDASKDIHVDGKLTLGENVADNGGIRLSFAAFLTTPTARGRKNASGYTPVQRFFLSYAQTWCVNRTDEAAKQTAQTDPHAPGKYRVNGVVANFPAFREAFACKVGTPMAPATMHRVW